MKNKAYRMVGFLFMLALMMVCTCSVHITLVDLPNDRGHACDMTATNAVDDCNECLTLADKVLDVTVDFGAVVWVSLDVGLDVTSDVLLVDFGSGRVHPPPPLYAIKMNC